MKVIFRLLDDFKSFHGKKKFYFIFAFGILVSIFSVLEPLFFANVLGKAENFVMTGEFDSVGFYFGLIFWIVFILSNTIIGYIYTYYLVDKNILRFYEKSQNEAIENSIKMQYGEYLQKKQGETVSRLERGRRGILNILFFIFNDIWKSMTSIVLVTIVMFYVDWRMALIVLIMVPIVIFMGGFFHKKTISLQNQLNKDEDNIIGKYVDGMGNLSLVKILGLGKEIGIYVRNKMAGIISKQFILSKRWGIANNYLSIIMMINRILIFGFGVYFIVYSDLKMAELVLFFSYAGHIYFPIGMIFGKFRDMQKNAVDVSDFYEEFYDGIKKENFDEEKKNLENISGKITFENVSFKYQNGKTIFEDLNFIINPGEKVAFVGNTGAGKTTIVNLLFRMWEVNSGKVFIDENNISEISKKSLRENIGIVTQDNSLFNATIKQNMLYAKENASNEEIENALQKAQANFVLKLKDGIETEIGERGLKLSGGEKQRLNIARLFLRNPQIVVLDEATSALDNNTEVGVQKEIEKLTEGKTLIVIAHRLSTIKKVDRIYMLENGKIIESGNYKELISQKGKFYKLANPDEVIF